MAEFKIDDIVKYSFDGIPGYGIVTKVTSKKISVYDFDDEDTVTILKIKRQSSHRLCSTKANIKNSPVMN